MYLFFTKIGKREQYHCDLFEIYEHMLFTSYLNFMCFSPLRLSCVFLANYVPKCQMNSGPYGPIFLFICRTSPRPKSLVDRLFRNPTAEFFMGSVPVKPLITVDTQYWIHKETGAVICEEADVPLRLLGGPNQTGVTGESYRKSYRPNVQPIGNRIVATGPNTGSVGATNVSSRNTMHIHSNVRRYEDNTTSIPSTKLRVGSQHVAAYGTSSIATSNATSSSCVPTGLSFGLSKYVPSLPVRPSNASSVPASSNAAQQNNVTNAQITVQQQHSGITTVAQNLGTIGPSRTKVTTAGTTATVTLPGTNIFSRIAFPQKLVNT